MRCFPISKDPSLKWFLLVQSSDTVSLTAGNEIAQVLNAVRYVFGEIFGKSFVDSHSTLNVVIHSDGPECFRLPCLIVLDSIGRRHQQQVYQFAHELCHFMVPEPVCSSYRWFEETLCCAMSWYTLQQLYNIRSMLPVPAFMAHYETVPIYIQESMNNRTPLSGNSFSSFVGNNLQHLREDCYDRSMNAAIAYQIYPLICECPELWRIVPQLHTLTDNMNLLEALNHLMLAANIADPLRIRVLSLFYK